MFKKTTQAMAIVTAMFGIHSAASACSPTDPSCTSATVSAGFHRADLSVTPGSSGIYVQLNNKKTEGSLALQNVVMRSNGDITADNYSAGNDFRLFELGTAGDIPLKHVYQSNSGATVANVLLNQQVTSVTGAVTLNAMAAGNSMIYQTTGKIAELSAIQCNTNETIASVRFVEDPTRITASASAFGNTIQLRSGRTN